MGKHGTASTASTYSQTTSAADLFGEVWIEDAAFLAPYQSGNHFNKKFDSNLPSITDFGFLHAVWQIFFYNKSINNIYETLAKDFLFNDPSKLLVFLDNHDIERIMFLVKENIDRFKLAIKLLLTTRGIPQIYYGTEIGLMGGKGHGNLRVNFLGGFPGDERNAFLEKGRTSQENDIFNFIKNLITLRKNYMALQKGKFIHFPPNDEVYIYFRVYQNEKIMVIINNNDYKKKVDLKPLGYMFKNANHLIDLETNQKIVLDKEKEIAIEGNNGVIYLLISQH